MTQKPLLSQKDDNYNDVVAKKNIVKTKALLLYHLYLPNQSHTNPLYAFLFLKGTYAGKTELPLYLLQSFGFPQIYHSLTEKLGVPV